MRADLTSPSTRDVIADGTVLLDGTPVCARLLPSAYPQLDALHLRPDGPPDLAALTRLGLTKRQAEVHALALRGHSAKQIANELVISRRTAEKHLEAIYARLGVANRAQAVAATIMATRNGLNSRGS